MPKKGIYDFHRMKKDKEKVTWITAYDFPSALAAEKSGIDMILVGDSGGMVQLGYETTNPVSMDEMITFSKSVRRGAPNTFIIGDMPQGSYEINESEAIKNAIRFVKEAGVDAIKLEGGKRISTKIKAISDAGIIVFGHLGLTPQSSSVFGGYKVQGKTLESFEEIVEDAINLENAGAQFLLLEAMPPLSAMQVSNHLNIPVYGIGAGSDLDGQLIIMHDILGFYKNFRPFFAKCYVPQVLDNFISKLKEESDLKEFGRNYRNDGFSEIAELAIKEYISEVKNGTFPGEDYSYPIKDELIAILEKSKFWL